MGKLALTPGQVAEILRLREERDEWGGYKRTIREITDWVNSQWGLCVSDATVQRVCGRAGAYKEGRGVMRSAQDIAAHSTPEAIALSQRLVEHRIAEALKPKEYPPEMQEKLKLFGVLREEEPAVPKVEAPDAGYEE